MRHVVPLHTLPAWHRRLAQHASPGPPHGGASGTPTSGTGGVVSFVVTSPALDVSRGASSWFTSGCAVSSRIESIAVSTPGVVSACA
jgi:hypothetical protein